MKVVIGKNSNHPEFSAFSISYEARKRLLELGMDKVVKEEVPGVMLIIDEKYMNTKEFRTHPLLIQVVEELGENANGIFSQLAVVDAPDDVEWMIKEENGREYISTEIPSKSVSLPKEDVVALLRYIKELEKGEGDWIDGWVKTRTVINKLMSETA